MEIIEWTPRNLVVLVVGIWKLLEVSLMCVQAEIKGPVPLGMNKKGKRNRMTFKNVCVLV